MTATLRESQNGSSRGRLKSNIVTTVVTDKPSVFAFPTFGSYLAAWVTWKKASDRQFSLRGLALRAKKSPSLITMIARGERSTTADACADLCRVMGLSAQERKYVGVLVEREHAKSPATVVIAENKLAALRPVGADHVIDSDAFELVSQWYHLTIVEMTEIKSFRPDPVWIASELGASVTPAMVTSSLELLLRLGLLAKTPEGSYRKTHERLRTTANIPSIAIRSCHKQLIQKAYNAVERQSVDERFLSTLTFPVPAHKLNEARQLIAEFRDQFVSTLRTQNEPYDEVYHLNIQFFRATAHAQTKNRIQGASAK